MIKASRGFSSGNFKKGLVEHVVSFSSEGLYHLTGAHRVNGISRVMVAYRDDGMARFYGVESLDQQDAYREVVRSAGFEPVGCYKITKRDAPDKENGGRKQIGERAQQGQITVRASGMLYWDKSVSQLLGVEPVECRAGEGYIEVLMGEGLQLDEPHDGQPARYYPPEVAVEAASGPDALVIHMVAIGSDPHFNRLSPADAELLAMLIEEAAEVQQIATKILRHGFNSSDPSKSNPIPNSILLKSELTDFFAVFRFLVDADLVDEPTEEEIQQTILRKIVWTHHQEPAGC